MEDKARRGPYRRGSEKKPGRKGLFSVREKLTLKHLDMESVLDRFFDSQTPRSRIDFEFRKVHS